jgi:hypothetical protein
MTIKAPGQHPCSQYLAGMCLAGLSVCAAGWLVVTTIAFAAPVSGTPGGKWNDAAVTTIATSVGLALVAAITFACWVRAWRRLLLADGALAREAGHRSRRHARRPRKARSVLARVRVRRASMHRSSGGVTRSDSEPEPVRPPNADRMLSELRDQLGPLMTVPGAEHPHAAPPSAQDASADLSPAAPGTAALDTAAPDTAAPGTAAPGTAAPGTAAPDTAAPDTAAPDAARAAQEAPAAVGGTGLVAICADGIITYDPEEDW